MPFVHPLHQTILRDLGANLEADLEVEADLEAEVEVEGGNDSINSGREEGEEAMAKQSNSVNVLLLSMRRMTLLCF